MSRRLSVKREVRGGEAFKWCRLTEWLKAGSQLRETLGSSATVTASQRGGKDTGRRTRRRTDCTEQADNEGDAAAVG